MQCKRHQHHALCIQYGVFGRSNRVEGSVSIGRVVVEEGMVNAPVHSVSLTPAVLILRPLHHGSSSGSMGYWVGPGRQYPPDAPNVVRILLQATLKHSGKTTFALATTEALATFTQALAVLLFSQP